MRFERVGPALTLVAALAAGAPALAAPARPDTILVEVCDALHPGRHIPLPVHRDREAPLTGCHAAGALMPARRERR